MRASGLILKQPVFREGSVLNIGEDLFHRFLGLICDDLRSGDVIAVLCGVGDGVSHSREAALIDQIHDQLHLMDTLKIRVLRCVASLNQSLDPAFIRAQTPPHSTACSPNRSVSVSTLKVVSRTPALAPPNAHA